MEPEGSLRHSQVPAICPYPEPYESSPCLPVPLLEEPFQFHIPFYAWVFHVVSFPQISPQKPCNTSLVFHPCHMPRPSHYSWFDHRIICGEQYRLLCSSLHSPVTSSLLGPNILLSILLSNTLSLRSSLSVCDQSFTPIKTTCKIIVCIS